MKHLLIILIVGITLYSCSSEEQPKKEVIEDTVGEIIPIETLFDSNEFEEKAHKELLEELILALKPATSKVDITYVD